MPSSLLISRNAVLSWKEYLCFSLAVISWPSLYHWILIGCEPDTMHSRWTKDPLMLSIFLSFLVNLGGIMRSSQDRVKRQSMKFNLDCDRFQLRRTDFVCKNNDKREPIHT